MARLFKRVAQAAFVVGLVLAQAMGRTSAQTQVFQHVDIDEILSYECARSITGIVTTPEQMGPLFSEGRLVFTSLEAQDSSKLLLVNAGYGNFAITLEGASVNRIRFALPTADQGPPRTFFLSYMHGSAMRSRYFEYSEGTAPNGHDTLDYTLVAPRRADYLLPHLDYAIHETAEAVLQAITDGRVSRDQLSHNKIENCEHISRESPNIARKLQGNLDQIGMIIAGPRPTAALFGGSGRGPASLTHSH